MASTVFATVSTPGPPGPSGPTGPPGYAPQFIVAAGAPSAGVGQTGDMYINSSTSDVYGPKTVSGWGPVACNIRGTTGATGPAGYSPQYIVAAGPPSAGSGNIGDMYINSSTSDVYGPKSASGWGGIVCNIKGATGATGPPGVAYTPKGAWSSSTTYAQGDEVTDAGILYISLQSGNLNHTPASSPTYWQAVAMGGSQTPWASDIDGYGHVLYNAGAIAIGSSGVNAGTRLSAYGGDIEILDAVTGRAIGFAVNSGGGHFVDPVTSASLARYGMSYLGDMGGSDSWNVALSGWGGLRFFTVDQERMRIAPGGQVGFGMVPTYKFNVQATGAWDGIHLWNGANDIAFLVNNASGGSALGLNNGATRKVNLDTDGPSYLIGGNFGIGTASPSALLHVSQPDASLGVLFNGASKGVRFGFGVNGTSIEGVDNTGVASFQRLLLNGSTVEFQASQVVIADNGNMGLGGLSASRLTVLSGATTPTAPVTNNQLRIGESSNNPSYGLYLGYIIDSVYKGSIQAIGAGTGGPLLIQPQGGPIGIGKTNPGAYAIDLAGDMNISGSYRVNGTPIGSGGFTAMNIYNSSQRPYGSTFQNTTGKPMQVTIVATIGTSGAVTVYCDGSSSPGTTVALATTPSGVGAITESLTIIVLPGYYYKVVAAGSITWAAWTEWS